jgi:hypothetical protein
MRCGGKVHWLYFCVTPKDWKEGDLIKKQEFDKTKRNGKAKEKGEKGCGRHGRNNATEVEAGIGKAAAWGRGEHGGGGNADDHQAGNAQQVHTRAACP